MFFIISKFSVTFFLLFIIKCNSLISSRCRKFTRTNNNFRFASSILSARNNAFGSENGEKNRETGKDTRRGLTNPTFKSAKGMETRLDQRKGARPLSKAELKVKDQFDALKEPQVERLHSPESRVPFSELRVGQKLRGRIISIKEFGMFVDIGSKKDGLLHIKDVSKDYFIQDLQSRFIPGQDVDVYIKFVEVEEKKLGLQMYPWVESDLGNDGSLENAYTTRTSLSNLVPRTEINGTVVRISNYGVFVDIGSDVDAFLHRRKMKISRKKRTQKPWELYPLGSVISCVIHRYSLTSDLYHPALASVYLSFWPCSPTNLALLIHTQR